MEVFSDAYVYIILVAGIIRYIGKGRGRRYLRHERIARNLNEARAAGSKVKSSRFYNRLAKAIRMGQSVISGILISGLTDEEAFKCEMAEIAIRPNGQLWNTYEGGQGLTSKSARALIRKLRSDPEFVKEHAARWPKLFADPVFRKAQSDRMRNHNPAVNRLQTDPQFAEVHSERGRISMLALHARPGFTEKQAARLRDLHTKLEFAEARDERLAHLNADPEFAKASGQRGAEHWRKMFADPEFAKAQADRMRARRADPQFEAHRIAAIRAACAARRIAKEQQNADHKN